MESIIIIIGVALVLYLIWKMIFPKQDYTYDDGDENTNDEEVSVTSTFEEIDEPQKESESDKEYNERINPESYDER